MGIDASTHMGTLLSRFARVRGRTDALAARLTADDQCAQSMADASPTKWHLAHTSWFFDRMLLAEVLPGYAPDPNFDYAFNSYYEAVGPRQPRPQRALLTRPGLPEVLAYRRAIDGRVHEALSSIAPAREALAAQRLELGLHHEEQHQELILTDAKHLLGHHFQRPAYVAAERPAHAPAAAVRWHAFDGGLVETGHAGEGFAFDNEGPRHKVWLEPFELASRPVTQGDVLEFIRGGGYRAASLWLSEGWDAVRAHGWQAPLYWSERDGSFEVYTLRGVEPIDPGAPACHLSFFEADAIARFFGARLPTEHEWEHVAATKPIDGNFVESGLFHPSAARTDAADGPRQLFGDVWEWTASAYAPYPRFRPLEGALGEYNGKFMVSQLVLRGGSCLSPASHLRATYRNFFPPTARWQMSGVRLARWA